MPRQKIAGKKLQTQSKAKTQTSVASGSKFSKTMKAKKTAPAEGGIKIRKFRFRAGTVALREIKRY